MTNEFQSPYPSPWYKSIPKQLRSRWLVGLLLAGGIAGGGLGIYRTISADQNASSQMVTTTVQQKSLPITLSANGTIKPERTINLSPKTSGYLKQLLVKEGDRVQQGQIVAKMDDSDLQGQLIQARAQLAQQQANLNKLLNGNRPEDIAQAQAQLSKAQADLRLAEDDLQRNQSLFSAGAISKQTVVQKQSARDAAIAAVNQAQAALKLQHSGTRKEDIAFARAEVESARGALRTIQTQLNDTIVKAPFTGVVTKKYSDPGSFVTPTTAGSSVEGAASNSIVTLVSTYQVVAYLDEANVARVKVGQPVKITADSYPDRTFSGTVSSIAAQATTTSNVTSFEVKVALDAAARQLLKVGMNVETEFQVGQLNNAILVPSAAIVRQQNGTGVYVVGQDKQPVFKPIEIGTTIDEQTQVKSGLSKDDRVLLSFPSGMEPAKFQGPLGNLTGNRNRNNNNNSSSGSTAP